jgi:hypothetical protein
MSFFEQTFNASFAGIIYSILLALMLSYIVLSLAGYPPRLKKWSMISAYLFMCIFAAASVMASGGITIESREQWLWLSRSSWIGTETVLLIGLIRGIKDIIKSYQHNGK